MHDSEGVTPLTRDDVSPFTAPGAFGSFRVMHQIGVGVLGPVFRTYEPSEDRLVAVKAFHLDITPEQAHILIEALGRLVEADMSHPGLVAPIAVGFEDSVPYMAQAYVAAESLDVAMRHYAPAPIETALPFITRIGEAIDAAHQQGIVHGALHLRDIFVTPDEARVTGFGVVKALGELRLAGPIRRPYTAPEVIAGREWGGAADVFALAAVAYELLTGRRAAGTGEQVTERLRAVEGVADSEALQAVFATALSENVDERYGSAARFVSSLVAAIGTEGSGATRIFATETGQETETGPSDLLAALDLRPGSETPEPADEVAVDTPLRPADRQDATTPSETLEAGSRAGRSTHPAGPGAVEVDDDLVGSDVDDAEELDEDELEDLIDEVREEGAGPSDDDAEREANLEVDERPAIEAHRRSDSSSTPSTRARSGSDGRHETEAADERDEIDGIDDDDDDDDDDAAFVTGLTGTEDDPTERGREAAGAGFGDEDELAREDELPGEDELPEDETGLDLDAAEEPVTVGRESSDLEDLFGAEPEERARGAAVLGAGHRDRYGPGVLLDEDRFDPADEPRALAFGLPAEWLRRGRGSAIPLVGLALGLGALIYLVAFGWGSGETTDELAPPGDAPTERAALSGPDSPADGRTSDIVLDPVPDVVRPMDTSAVPPVAPPSAEAAPEIPVPPVAAPPRVPAAAPAREPAAAPPPRAVPVDLTPPTGWLLVRTEPPGAVVTVNGQARGETPISLDEIPFGDHQVEVTHPAFPAVTRVVTVGPDDTVAAVRVTLGAEPTPEPSAPPVVAGGSIDVDSRPPGARVMVDGEFVGTTPTVVSAAAGQHQIRIESDGYQPWVTVVAVASDQRTRLAASLDRLRSPR